MKLAQAAIAIAGAILAQGASIATFHPEATISSQMEYLIVFSVAAMMIGYVCIIDRYLRNA